MKQWRLILGVTTSAVLVAFLATMVLGAGAEAKKADVVDTIAKMENLKTLASAIKDSGLTEELKGKGPFTILAPSDAAWKKIPEARRAKLLGTKNEGNKERLASRVRAQVFDRKIKAADLAKAELEDAAGKTLKVTTTKDGKLKIGTATVITADIECSNGIIHVVDTLLPPGP